MISLITFHVEPSKLSEAIYFFNPIKDKDAVSYLFCSVDDSKKESDFFERVKAKFFNNDFFLSETLIEKKQIEWNEFLEEHKPNGIVDIYPNGNKINVICYGDLCVLHFKDNKLEKQVDGSFGGMITFDSLEIDKDDVLFIALKKEVFSSDFDSDFDVLYNSEQFPMIFVDDIDEAETLVENNPKMEERVKSIIKKKSDLINEIPKIEVFVEGDLGKNEVEKVSEEAKGKNIETTIESYTEKQIKDSFSNNDPTLFNKLIHNESLRGALIAVLCFLIGFVVVILIMFFIK